MKLVRLSEIAIVYALFFVLQSIGLFIYSKNFRTNSRFYSE